MYMKKTIVTNIAPWGNSLAIRIPKEFLEEGGFASENPVEISLNEKTITIKGGKLRSVKSKEHFQKAFKSRLSLKTKELNWGKPKGGEVW